MSDDTLDNLRRESNAVDYELLEALARRIDVVKRIGQHKKRHAMAVLQLDRWKEVIEDRLKLGRELVMHLYR